MQERFHKKNEILTFVISGVKGKQNKVLQEIKIYTDETTEPNSHEHTFSILIDSILDV
jgi:hypothetical protein